MNRGEAITSEEVRKLAQDGLSMLITHPHLPVGRLVGGLNNAALTIESIHAENERLKEYEAAVRESHNGYDLDCRASMPTLKEPESPKAAIELLLVEAEEIGQATGKAMAEDQIASLTSERDALRQRVEELERAAKSVVDDWNDGDGFMKAHLLDALEEALEAKP